jgi:spermidine synthase/MFS family permease
MKPTVQAKRSYSDRFLLLLVFFGGMAVLGVELTASRLLAPFFGNNLFVWANVIGLTLLYLSAGYILGGRLADRRPDDRLLIWIVAVAAAFIAVVPFIARPILALSVTGLSNLSAGLFLGSLFGVLVLLAVPITLLGFVSPFAIRLASRQVESAGQVAGRVYAIGTVGSIIGAFLPVLVLVPNLGTRNTFLFFSLVLLVIAAAALRRPPVLALLALAIALTVWGNVSIDPIKPAETGELIYEDESLFNYIQVVQAQDGPRRLILNNEERLATHSVYWPDQSPQPLSGGPWDYFLLAPYFREQHPGEVTDVLVIGLGAGTAPKLYAENFGPHVRIDGVEIDPGVIDAGVEYFAMNEAGLNAIAEDGRVFLNQSQKTYDVVILDAYRPPYIPFHLTTREFYQEVADKLAPDGVLVSNVGRGPSRDNELLDLMAATLRSVFPAVVVTLPDTTSNSLVYALKRPVAFEEARARAGAAEIPAVREVAGRGVSTYQVHTVEGAFTDDLAPVEQVVNQLIIDYALGR